MEVELLAYTGPATALWRWIEDLDDMGHFEDDNYDTYPDMLTELAGRTCYRSEHRPRPETATNESYLRRTLIEQGHGSIAEHASASFLVRGVSRHLLGELTRHRHLSFSVESLRYCPPREYVVHPTLKDRPEYELLLKNHWDASVHAYTTVYNGLLAEGLKKKEAAEAAAQFLPLSTATDLAVTGNMRAWRDVIIKRIDPAANREIRVLAHKILDLLRDVAPNTFADFEDGTWDE